MGSRATSFVTGSLVLSVALAGVCLIPGCSGSSNETGTMVTKSPAVAAAEKKSMEGMKAMMKKLGKEKKKR